jgi:hypothetical protein
MGRLTVSQQLQRIREMQVSEKHEDDRKEDDGTAGPRPQGLRQGEKIEELESRHKFLRDVHAKVVESPKRDKAKGTEGAQHK